MADFCRQCWGDNYQGNLENLTTESDTNNGTFAVAICEGCGVIQVDHTGLCVSTDCYSENHATIFDNKD